MEFRLHWDGGDHFLYVVGCHAMKSFEYDQQCFEFNPVFDWKPVKRNECGSYAIIFPQIENESCSCVLHTLEFLDEIIW